MYQAKLDWRAIKFFKSIDLYFKRPTSDSPNEVHISTCLPLIFLIHQLFLKVRWGKRWRSLFQFSGFWRNRHVVIMQFFIARRFASAQIDENIGGWVFNRFLLIIHGLIISNFRQFRNSPMEILLVTNNIFRNFKIFFNNIF